jgi:hypothetical protein
MRSLLRCSAAVVAVLLFASVASAAPAIASGKVKGVNADKKEFVMTDGAGKDWTFKLADNVVMNRGGKESTSALAPGDNVFVHYDKGIITWSADYILIREGDSRNWELAHGNLKGYEADKQLLTVTDENGKDTTLMAREAKAFTNNKECKFDDLKIGEHVLMIVAKDGGKTTLKTAMVTRK